MQQKRLCQLVVMQPYWQQLQIPIRVFVGFERGLKGAEEWLQKALIFLQST